MAPAFLAPLLFSLVIFSIFETGLTNQFFPEPRPDTYIKPFSAFQVLATKRTDFWVVIISMPLVSQRHLLGFLIAALDLAAAARLVAVGAGCQGDELVERQGSVPTDIPQMASNFAEIVPSPYRQGNFPPFASIR